MTRLSPKVHIACDTSGCTPERNPMLAGTAASALARVPRYLVMNAYIQGRSHSPVRLVSAMLYHV